MGGCDAEVGEGVTAARTHTPMPWEYTDGGRSHYFSGRLDAGDCVTRAWAAATGRDYRDCYDDLADAAAAAGQSRSARGGVLHKVYRPIFDQEFNWVPIMRVGSGCTVRLNRDEFPGRGTFIVRLSRHLTTVIDGVVFDNHDPSRDGTRCVYGYWEV